MVADTVGFADSVSPRMRTVYSELKRAHLRPTSSRVAVLKVFHDAPLEHLSADQVFRRIASDVEQCSLASVYRALAQLMDSQLLTSTWVGETRVVYELGRGAPHAHLVCEGCKTVCDIDEPALQHQHASIAASKGFRYTHSSLVVFGLCAACTPAA
ncbi:Fur family ferric uptake transcriptional regulator [Paraburkholderia unamae]|uniref:Ferric uptake regulation protein n=2 Tax=Paraburkholderia unamae TaxID=219649 RepID=A0ABX5KEM5_9BURK|nr:Fur family ferric uptake transcriptional regulator [Paraburkholderia unamae]CAG9271056.1 Ferric uptake regulation protein [Paraburkholderia unamae]